MTRSIGNVSAILSVNTTAFSKGLDSASHELTNFGRKVSDSFGASLPASQFSAVELELARFSEQAGKAGKALEMPRANQSIQALKGGLFLLTGETGYFAVQALSAAKNVAVLTTATGGFTAAVTAAAVATKAFVVSIPGIGWAIAAAAGVYAIGSKLIGDWTDELVAKERALTEAYERQKPSLDRLMESRWAAAAAMGKITEQEAKRRGMLLNDAGMAPSTADEILKNEALVAQLKAQADSEQKRLENFGRLHAQSEQDNLKIISDRAAEQHNQEWDRAIALDKLAEDKATKAEQDLKRQNDLAKSLMVTLGAAKASDFEADPNMKALMQIEERINALKETQVIGADFAISSMAFRPGEAPVGHVIGQQREHKETIEVLKEGNKLTSSLADEIRKLTPVTITR